MVRTVFFVFLFAFFSFFSAAAEVPREVPQARAQAQLSYAPVVKAAAPAVVNIYTRKVVRQRVASPFMDDPFFQFFFGGAMPQAPSRQRLESSLGSGVIVRPEGIIVTSNHVIEGADEIAVVLADRREFEAKIAVSDEKADLAVLRIFPKGEALPFLQIKDSDEVEVGDMVLAIGNPFGVGQTVTSGIVSALARTSLDINDLNYFIQTDAAINPGNSGGALVGMDGRLIGINTAIYSRDGGNMGIGFAVPSNMARAVLASMETGGKKFARPWTGIDGQEVTNDVAASLGLARPVGLLVNAIHPDSPALKAGLKVGDVIGVVGGKSIEDPSAFSYRIAMLPLNSQVKLEVYRAGGKRDITIDLIAPPEIPARQETNITGQVPLSGATIANLSPAVQEEYGLRGAGDRGVVIVGVASGSAAARLGLAKGDKIESINGEKTENVPAVRAAIEKNAPRGWKLVLSRGGEKMTLMIR